MTRFALVVLTLGLAACSDKAEVEKWEPVMGQSGFALQGLYFDEHNLMHAVGGDGTTLVRRADWNAWVPLPSLAAVTGVPGTVIPRAWDVNGNVYFGHRVIYRMAKGQTEWKRVPGSVGMTLITVDPAGNVYATGPRGSQVLPAGAQAWVPTPVLTRVDANGRAYAGNRRLDGAAETVDEGLVGQAVLFDARGDVLEFTNDATSMKVTRRPFASKQTTTLTSFPLQASLALLGCGLEGTCNFSLGSTKIFRARSGGALEQIGDTTTTSTNDELNLEPCTKWVGADGFVYVSDVSGQTTSSSRVHRLRPGGTWPEVAP